MTLDQLLNNYWSQITLLLFAIGYFIQRIYELKLKKEETRHSLFQQNKIDTIMRFLSCYGTVEIMWIQIPYFQIFQNKLSAKEIDSIIQPSLSKLLSTRNELTIFFDEKQLALFDKIIDSALSLNDKILYSNFETGNKEVFVLTNEFATLRNKVLANNKQVLSEIGQLSRRVFNG